MAGSIKGIIVEIGGDTSKLQEALKKVNSSTASLSKELRGINSLLKLDPKNTELLSQKQAVLKQNIEHTAKKLEELKEAQRMADETIANGGKISQENYRNLQRDIINTQNKLKQLKVEASNWTKASERLNSISKGLNKISTITSDIGSKINKSITIPMIALGTATATTSIGFLKLKEDTKTAFKVLLGSTEAAQKMLEDLHKFAKTTPFSYATYLKTGKSLVSMGIAAENVIPYLEGITNAAIATGNGEEAITSISSALGKMTTQTKLSLEYMYQISDQGIPVFKILGNQLGVSTSKLMEMISAGKLASKDMIPKLIKGINEGTNGINGATSAFAGLATETKSNLSGALDSLKSKFRNMSMEIWNAEEAYPELNKIIREFTKSLDVLPKIFKSLSKAAVPILQNITKVFNILNEKLSKMDDEQLRKFGNAILGLAAAGPILSIVGRLTGGLSTLFSIGSKLSGTMAQLSAGTGVFARTLTLLTGPAGIIIGIVTAITALLVVLYNKSETFRNSVNKAFETIKDTLNKMWQKIKPQLEELGKVFGTLLEKLKPLANFLVKVLGVAFEILAKVLSIVIERIVKKISFMIKIVTLIINAWNKIITFFTETLPNAIQTFINYIRDLPKKIWNFLVNGWNSIVSFFTERIPAFINSVIQWFQKLPYNVGLFIGEMLGNIIKFGIDTGNWLSTELPIIIQGIVNWFAKLPENIWNWLVDAYNKVVQWGLNTYNSATQWISNTINSVSNWFSQLPGRISIWLTETVKKVIDWGEDLKKAGIEAINTLIDSVTNAIKELPNKAVEWGKDMVQGFINGIKSKTPNLSNAAESLGNKIHEYLHFSKPDKGPLRNYETWMPDMVKGLATTLKNSSPHLYKECEILARRIKNAMNISSNIDLANEARNINGKINGLSTMTNNNNIIVQFYPQKMTDSEIDRAFNYIDKKYGLLY